MTGVRQQRTMTSREFNQDTAGAKRAAADGPVVITDRGEPSHVLMTMAAYEALVRQHTQSLADALAGPPGAADIDLPVFERTMDPMLDPLPTTGREISR